MQAQIDGLQTFWHQAEPRTAVPALYVHGVPTNADQWKPFLDRLGGIALDLPGFGRSDKPSGFDYSLAGYRGFLRRFVEARELERFSLVVHDWGGAIGLALAQDIPERVERIVVIDALPLLSGYRWHRIARGWRTPVIGELMMGFTTRWGLKHASREATTLEGPLPQESLDLIWTHWDQGTMRAILKLYRSAPPELLARAGQRLADLRRPALVVWGAQDPYVPVEFASKYAEALGARLEVLDPGGHWVWVDRPEAVDLVAEFLLGSG